MQDNIFYTVCFGFLLGVLARSFYFVNFYIVILVAGIAIATLLLLIIFNLHERLGSFGWAGNKWGIVIFIFILAFSLGILRFNYADAPAPVVFETRVVEKITFTGIIADEPNVRENNQHLTVKLPETKILVIAGLEENYKYGDEVKVAGRLQKPENFITDQGKLFDYVNYLRKEGIFYTVIYPDTEIISREHGNPIKRGLFFVKNKFLEKINLTI